MPMSYIFLLFSFGMILYLGVVILASKPSPQERLVDQRVTNIRNARRPLQLTETGISDDGSHSHWMKAFGKLLDRFSLSSVIKKLLAQSSSRMSLEEFVCLSIASGIVGSIVLPLFLFRSLFACLSGATSALFLPSLVMTWRRHKRSRKIGDALPEAADLMGRALRAGHSITQSVVVLAEQSAEPLRSEFHKVFQQQKLGIPLRDALLEMGDRVPCRDLQFLITAIMIQRETGGDLADILSRTATVLRERARLLGEVKIHTAQGRLTGWILSLLPLLLMALMMLFSPTYIGVLFTDPLGRHLIELGGLLILVGGVIIRQIVSVGI